jgi:N-acetyltransferase
MIVLPVTLTGRLARLEPLGLQHVSSLAEAGNDETIWRLMPYGMITSEDRMRSFVRTALERQQVGSEQPFAVIDLASGRAIGSTRYLDIRPEHRGLEIGATWYGTAHQRTGINTECKYLLLRHAFDELGCIRVQLKTDLRNERSQRAIERIGGIREGVLRNHMIMPDGHRRATVMFSITDEEWPAVRSHLHQLMTSA